MFKVRNNQIIKYVDQISADVMHKRFVDENFVLKI